MTNDSSTTPAPRPAFSDRRGVDVPSDQEQDYRGVSRTAVVAFLVGLVSPLALVHPLSWAIPWIGVPVAWQALRRIAAPNSVVSGRPIALIGLFLTVLFGAWAPTKYLVERNLVVRQSQQFADTWLRLVRGGHLQEAHRWMLAPYQRDAPLPTREFYEQNVHLQEDLETEFTSEPANWIASQPESTTRFVSAESVTGNEQDQTIVLRYILQSNRSDRDDVEFFVRVQKSISGGETHWQLSSVYTSP
jgi:hypothetical protein